ncbi:MAG: hypothetical protein JSU92_11130 [Deltaproteobacteria bacterium]|nr:MAG: hypothetical protein JSU92_11130 [Deltaproteobacteria bacterium]
MPDKTGSERKRIYSIGILLIATILLVNYGNSLKSSFHFDDFHSIVENPVVRNLGNISAIIRYNPFRSVLTLSFALNYYFGGYNTLGYHLVNTLLHLANGLLIYLVILFSLGELRVGVSDFLMAGRHKVALLSALLFLAHPVMTESVTYIISRSSVLCTTFYLMSFYLFIRARGFRVTSGKEMGTSFPLFFLFSIIFFFLALFTKETAATLPVTIFVFDFLFISRSERGESIVRTVRYHLPFWGILFIYFFLRYSYFDTLGNPSSAHGTFPYLLTQFTVIVNYIRLIFFPLNLNVDPDFPVFSSLRDPSVFFSLVILMAILILAGMFYKYSRWVSFGVLWFFITLLPTSSIVPLLDVMAEHRMYLPTVGLCLIVGMGVMGTFNINPGRFSWLKRKTAIAGLLMVFILLSLGTVNRNRIYGHDLDLWLDTVKKSPNKARPHYCLGVARYKEWSANHYEEDLDDSIVEYQKAIDFFPEYVDAHRSLGISYTRKSLFTEAIEEFHETLTLRKNDPDSHKNLGVIYYYHLKDAEKALYHFRQTLASKPHQPEAGEIMKAIAGLEKELGSK